MTTSSNFSSEDILCATPDPVVVVDGAGRIAYANHALFTLLGFQPDEVIGLPVETLVPPGLRERHLSLRAAFAADPKARAMGAGGRLLARHKSGHDVPVAIDLAPLRTGGALQTISLIRGDAAARRREDELEARMAGLMEGAAAAMMQAEHSEENLRLFVKHVPAAVAMLDRQMRYLAVSDRWLADYGLGQRNLTGLSHYEVFPELPDEWKAAHRRCLAGETLKSDEDSFIRPDGKTDWLRWELHPWRTGAGEIGGLMLFTEVITPRKLAELALAESREGLERRVAERTRELDTARQEAVEANALKSRFLAAASHDLRQPLQTALGYLAALERRQASERERDLCEQALRPLKAMSDILDVLLDISRLDRGAIVPEPRAFPVDDMFARLAASHRRSAEEKGVRIDWRRSGATVLTDPGLLERVLDNLISNAVRYTERGRIELLCEPRGDQLSLSVIDTGIGIAEADLGRIFDEYVQLDNPARDRNKGLGLGLAMAKYLVDKLGLRIEVRSKVGEGSTFSVFAPKGTAPSEGEAPKAGGSVQGEARLAVLAVDDDSAVLGSLLMLLELEDIEGRGALSRAEALALIGGGFRPDVIISDYRLPGDDGLNVIRTLRVALGAEPPAILLTGDTTLSDRVQSELGDCTVLHKPVDARHLADAVRGAVAHDRS